MRKKITLLSVVIFILGITFISCKKEYFDFDKMREDQWQNVNMQVPLINTSLVLRDILKDYDKEELFEVSDDGFLSLIYNNTAFTEYAENLIVLNDITFPTDIITGDQSSGSNKIIHKNFNFSSFPGAQLDSVRYDSITIEINLTHNMTTTGALTVQFPGLTKNGNIAQVLVSNTSGITTQLFTGYELDLATNGPNNIAYNYIFDGWVGTAGQSIDISLKIKDQNYKIINGYIGHHDIFLPEDSVLINIFEQKFEGQFYFEDPRIKLTTINSFGLPIKLNLDTIYGKDYDNNYSPFYLINFEKNPVNYPTIKGETSKDSSLFVTNTTTPNSIYAPWIKDFIEAKPKYVFFDGDASINPNNNIDHSNFVIDTSSFKLNFEFQLPLWGRAEYPSLKDTSKLDMEKEFSKLDDLTYLKFRFDINNGMATEVRIQAYFMDSLGFIKDSLFMNKEDWILIDGGVTDANGKVVQKTRKITEIVFPRNRIDKLRDVTDIIYIAEFRTDDIENNKLVKFYADDAVYIKMGIHVKGGTDFDFSGYEDDTTSSN